MVGRWITLAFAMLAGCAAPFVNKWQTQRSVAAKLMPAELLVPEPAPTGEPITFLARVYADQEVRRLPFWRKRLGHSLERADAYLTAAFGVHLQVEIREWERGAPGDSLDRILAELGNTDPATDVDWVIGVVAPTAQLTTSHHEMGMAQLVGRHMVVRSTNDAVEKQNLDSSFDALDESDREELFTARRVHKELAIFLHEWAHSLGALHEGGPEQIMNVSYDHHVSTFSPDQAALIRLGLQIRLAERKQDAKRVAELWTKVVKTVEGARANFFQLEREQLLAQARRYAGVPVALGPRRTGEDQAEWDAALAAARGGDLAGAFGRIEALLAKYPSDTSLRKAAAGLYANVGALTRAEALVAEAEDRARLVAKRRWYGLPRDATRFGVTAELEPEYVAAFEDAHAALSESLYEDVKRKTAAALKRFPDAPGLLALGCAAELMGRHEAKARTACARALAGWEETVLAHFFAGQLDKGPEGRKHLERVLELDPKQESIVRPLLDAKR